MHVRSTLQSEFVSCFIATTRFSMALVGFVLLLVGGVGQMAHAQLEEKAPRLIYKNADENELLITLAATNELAIWDAKNDTLKRILSLVDENGNECKEPRSVVYTKPGFIWVACFASNEIWVIDEQNDQVVGTVGGLEAPWELDHSATKDFVIASAWGGAVGQWAPSQSGDRSGKVALLEADPNDSDFGTLVPESELPGNAPNPIDIPSTGDGGPWGAAACEGIFFITNDGTDTTYKLTIDPFALEIFDKGELPWEVECRAGSPMKVVIGNGGDDKPPGDGIESMTVDGPMRDRNGDPVQTSFATFPGRDSPNACWNTIFDSWSDPQKEKYSNHTELPWYNKDNPPSGAADLTRARSGVAFFTIITILKSGECKYKRISVGSGSNVEPWAAEIGPNFKVYMVDMHENVTREYDPSTGSIRKFKNQRYEAPRDIAVMNGKLYVANTGNHTISSQKNGEPGSYDYSDTEKSGLEVFDLGSGNPLLQHPLPVELARFEATFVGKQSVRLSWHTASEQKNAGFRVQHRALAAGTWQTLEFVESKASGGTTTKAHFYQFEVEDLSVGTHRFRLKQVDLDGTTDLSRVVRARVRMKKGLRLTSPRPNPVHATATVRFGVRTAHEARVAVFDALGRRVMTLYEGTPAPGQMHRMRIRTTDLSSGTYIVRLTVGNQTKTEHLTVVR